MTNKIINKQKVENMQQRQQGFSLVVVIFLLVIISSSVVFMTQLSSVQNATLTLSVQGAKAYQAATAGVEWGIRHALDGNCTTSFDEPFIISDTVGGTSTLNDFSVRVQCNSSSYTEAGATICVFQLTSEADWGTFGTTPDYVSRQISASIQEESGSC